MCAVLEAKDSQLAWSVHKVPELDLRDQCFKHLLVVVYLYLLSQIRTIHILPKSLAHEVKFMVIPELQVLKRDDEDLVWYFQDVWGTII